MSVMYLSLRRSPCFDILHILRQYYRKELVVDSYRFRLTYNFRLIIDLSIVARVHLSRHSSLQS